MSEQLLVIGGIALDITATVGKSFGASILHTSTPGHVKQSLGGVGRNVAEAAWRTGARVKLVSVVGDDLAGESVKQGLKSISMVYSPEDLHVARMIFNLVRHYIEHRIHSDTRQSTHSCM